MKNKRKRDKRFRHQNAHGLPEAAVHNEQAPVPDSAAPDHAATLSSPDFDSEPSTSATASMPSVDADRCVSETFLTLPGKARLFSESLGQRLAASRDAKGWSRAETASRLRLPLHIVQKIEADDYASIGHGIYLRGYLNNYARLVGVPFEAVEEVMRDHASPPPQLVASGRISHSRYLFDRYSGAALYVVLTGVIFVPLIMFAMNMGGDVSARLLPLDVPAGTSQQSTTKVDIPANSDTTGPATTQTAVAPTDGASNTTPTPASAPSEVPLLASFAPIANPPRVPTDPAAQSSGQSVRLVIAEASWVEIVDSDGKRLEYGILSAGTIRNYTSEKALDVRIGNTTGARLEVNGEVQDIAPFNHGNVAHFKLFAAGKTISRTDS